MCLCVVLRFSGIPNFAHRGSGFETFLLVEFDVAKIQCERALVNSFTLISYFLISLIINALIF